MSSADLLLQRYAEIIPDVQDFINIIQQPLPTCCWTNTLKTTPDRLCEILKQEAYQLKPLAWNALAFRCEGDGVLGKSWPYLAGLLQIQEEVSMLPGVILDAQPGEKILDLCAAPGNKTAQLSVAMQNRGMLIANDRNYGRMRALGQIQKRLSLMNISTTVYDGIGFPRINNYFDKVLVDAPCSCEGTIRKSKEKNISISEKHSLGLAKTQLALLRKAIKLCKPGGKIVYSTCTFAPEENESVVHQALQEYGDNIRVLPINIKNFKSASGLTFWKNQEFDSSIKNTMRVWPHFNNTGGFFVALLEKGKKTFPKHKVIIDKPKEKSDEINHYLAILEKRFSIPVSILKSYQFSYESQRGIYLGYDDNCPPKALKTDATGLFFMKTKIRYPKLSTSAAMLLGNNAKQNIIELDREQLTDYLSKKEIAINQEQLIQCNGMGYVLVKFQEFIMGLGLYLPNAGNQPARLQSLFPQYLQGP